MELSSKLHDRVYLPLSESLRDTAICKWDEDAQGWGFDVAVNEFENHYALSPSELLELKKLWSGEAWEAGAWAEQDGHNARKGDKPKQDFIDNLKLD